MLRQGMDFFSSFVPQIATCQRSHHVLGSGKEIVMKENGRKRQTGSAFCPDAEVRQKCCSVERVVIRYLENAGGHFSDKGQGKFSGGRHITVDGDVIAGGYPLADGLAELERSVGHIGR